VKGIIAGAGYFAGFHAEAWNRLPGTFISAVADPDVPRAQQFARRWNIPAVYESVELALGTEHPDFIDIVTRPESHVTLTKLAADHRVAVICQKPMAPTLDDCREMVDYCERAGVRLCIHENWRWQPWYREGRRLLDDGLLGRPYYLGLTIRTGDGRGSEPYLVQPYFRSMPKLLVYETLVHFLDTMRFLGGEFAELHCRTARINPAIAGEDSAVITARMDGSQGLIDGLIDANRISGPSPPEIAFGSMRFEGERAALRMDPQGNLFLTNYGEAERPHVYGKPETGYKGDSVLATQRHIVECLISGHPTESEGRLYLKTVEAVEACYRSAETTCLQRLSTST
jgi:D-apiose dehydrogenase